MNIPHPKMIVMHNPKRDIMAQTSASPICHPISSSSFIVIKYELLLSSSLLGQLAIYL